MRAFSAADNLTGGLYKSQLRTPHTYSDGHYGIHVSASNMILIWIENEQGAREKVSKGVLVFPAEDFFTIVFQTIQRVVSCEYEFLNYNAPASFASTFRGLVARNIKSTISHSRWWFSCISISPCERSIMSYKKTAWLRPFGLVTHR